MMTRCRRSYGGRGLWLEKEKKAGNWSLQQSRAWGTMSYFYPVMAVRFRKTGVSLKKKRKKERRGEGKRLDGSSTTEKEKRIT